MKSLRRSAQITLLILSTAALTACADNDEQRRSNYRSQQDCVQDWGPQACGGSPVYVGGVPHWYGPTYYVSGGRYYSSGGTVINAPARAASNVTISKGSFSGGSFTASAARGGFGSSASASS